MRVGSDGKIESSGQGIEGLLAAWRSVADLFTVELPRLLAVLFRLR